tara:strand:- start:57 stop:1886 length:1830 start_codon:yes stop_codon:yes gene_type:complete
MATGISISELRKANGKKLRIFLNQFVSDEDMVFLRNASDTEGIDKSPAALYFTADAINKITNLSPKKIGKKISKRYTPSTASRAIQTIHDAVMATTAQGEWILDTKDFKLTCKRPGLLRGEERVETPLSSLAKTELYGGTFRKAGAVGGVDTEVMSEVLSMYCLAYRIVNGKLLTTGSDFNIGSDLNSTIWPSVAKRCWVPSNTFSFKKPKDRADLISFANKKAGGSKYTWLESCIAQSKIMMQKLTIKGNANIFSDKFFAKGTSKIDPYTAYLASGNTADPNKWNPADIWIFNSEGLSEMRRFNADVKKVGKSVITLNQFLVKQWDDKNIYPISLKKLNPASPNFSLVNSNQYVERISIDDQKNPLVIEFDDNRSNRDVKINFVLETIKLNKGLTAEKVQRNIFGNIGKVDKDKNKEIRLKFKVSTRGIDLEYQQTGGKKYSEAKGGALGYQEYNKIISGTSKQGIYELNKIKKNYNDTDLLLNRSTGNFTSHGVNIGKPNVDIASRYLDEIWKCINNKNMTDDQRGIYKKNPVHMKDKVISGELGISIHKISNQKVKETVIQNLYNACASVGIGMGVDKGLLAQVGAGIGRRSQNIKFLGGIHGKVY